MKKKTDEALDLKQLRDPMGFINGVDKFIQDTEKDLKTLKHFSSTYKGSTRLPFDQKGSMAKVDQAIPGVEQELGDLEQSLSGAKNVSTKNAEKEPEKRQGMFGKLANVFRGNK